MVIKGNLIYLREELNSTETRGYWISDGSQNLFGKMKQEKSQKKQQESLDLAALAH